MVEDYMRQSQAAFWKFYEGKNGGKDMLYLNYVFFCLLLFFIHEMKTSKIIVVDRFL